MEQRLEWILRNGALAVALYLAVVDNVGWLQYAIAAFAWGTLAIGLWIVPAYSASRNSGVAASLQAATMVFDLGVLVSMFLAQWYWTVFAYAVARACSALVQARAAGRS